MARSVRRWLVTATVLLTPACSFIVDTGGLDDGPGKADAASGATARLPDGGDAVGDAGSDGATASPDGGGRGDAEAGAFEVPKCGVLASGGVMHVEDRVKSCNDKFVLVYQADGNIVLYDDKGPIFATATYDHPVDRVVMQPDGDFVVLGPEGQRWFASGTAGSPGAFLWIQDDGHITVNTDVEHWRGNPEYGQ